MAHALLYGPDSSVILGRREREQRKFFLCCFRIFFSLFAGCHRTPGAVCCEGEHFWLFDNTFFEETARRELVLVEGARGRRDLSEFRVVSENAICYNNKRTFTDLTGLNQQWVGNSYHTAKQLHKNKKKGQEGKQIIQLAIK